MKVRFNTAESLDQHVATKTAHRIETRAAIAAKGKAPDASTLTGEKVAPKDKNEPAPLEYPEVNGVKLTIGAPAFVLVDGPETKPIVATLATVVGYSKGKNTTTFAYNGADGDVPTVEYDAVDGSWIWPHNGEGRRAAEETAALESKTILLRNARSEYEKAYYEMGACTRDADKAVKVFSEAPRQMRIKMVFALGLNGMKELGGTTGMPTEEVAKVFARLHKQAHKSHKDELAKVYEQAVSARKELREKYGDAVKVTNAQADAEERAKADAERERAKKERAEKKSANTDPAALTKKLAASLGVNEADLAALLAKSFKKAEGK